MNRLLCFFLVVAACAGTPARVSLRAGWPAAAPSWDGARERWTRRAGYSADWTRVVEVAATLESDEWRAAYAAERSKRLRLPADETAKLVEAQKAAAAEVWEVELVMATAKPEWNDLRKYPGSIWRVSLVGEGDREVAPISVVEDKRPRAEVAAYFPDLQPFYQPYVVKFPKTTPDGRPLAGSALVLKVSSPIGAIEMTWRE